MHVYLRVKIVQGRKTILAYSNCLILQSKSVLKAKANNELTSNDSHGNDNDDHVT